MNSKLTRREQLAMDEIHRDAPCSAQDICGALEISIPQRGPWRRCWPWPVMERVIESAPGARSA